MSLAGLALSVLVCGAESKSHLCEVICVQHCSGHNNGRLGYWDEDETVSYYSQLLYLYYTWYLSGWDI